MTEALLYQPNQKWRIGAAFGAAALIHFAAIAFAGLHQHARIAETVTTARDYRAVVRARASG